MIRELGPIYHQRSITVYSHQLVAEWIQPNCLFCLREVKSCAVLGVFSTRNDAAAIPLLEALNSILDNAQLIEHCNNDTPHLNSYEDDNTKSVNNTMDGILKVGDVECTEGNDDRQKADDEIKNEIKNEIKSLGMLIVLIK